MKSRRYLLDTSAVLALVEDEDGADRVEALLRTQDVIVPFVVLLESHYISRREQGEAEADRRYALLRQLTPHILWEVDEPTLLTAARLKALNPISLADALIAAFAIQNDAILVHKDAEYEVVAGEVELETLPCKPVTG